MKKIIVIMVLLVVLFAGCSSPVVSKQALAAAKKMLKSLTVLMTKTTVKMEKATTAKQTGKVLVAYAKQLAKVTVQAATLKKKYPDFDDAAKDGSLTKEAKALQKKVGALNDLYTDAEKKYKEDKDFVASLLEMKKIMADAEKKVAPVKADDKKVTVSIKTNVKVPTKKVSPRKFPMRKINLKKKSVQ